MAEWPDPRSIVVSMAFGNTLRDTSPTWEVLSPGTDENDPGPVQGPVMWERGRLGDAPETAPTKIALRLRDEDGEFSRRNVSSSRYGTLLEGTPVRLAVDFGAGPVTIATSGVLRFAPVWDGEHDDGTTINPRVPINSTGVLTQIGRDAEVRSAARWVLGYYGVALYPGRASYWPLETSLDSEVPGGPTLTGGPFVATSGPLGSDGAMDMSGAVSVSGPLALTGETAWSFAFAVKMTTVTGTAVPIAILYVDGVAYATISVDDTVGAELIVALSRDGASGSTTFSAATIDDGDWHTIDLSLTNAGGGQTSANITYDGAGVGVAAQAVTYAEPDSFAIGGATELTGLAHVAAQGSFYDDAVRLANAGETVDERVTTMLQTLGLDALLDSDAPTAEMGPWPPQAPMATLREGEDVDGGVVFEDRTRAIKFQSLDNRYNIEPALTLAWADFPGADALDDDRDTYNVVTATDPDGNFAIVEETDGPVGTDAIGERRLPITRNVYDPDNLRHHAGWVARKGTIDQPRYIVYLDLFNQPEIAALWAATNVGSRIVVTGAPAQHVGPDDLDLIVEGERGSLMGGGDSWVELHCQPYQPHKVMVWAEESTPDLHAFLGRWATERHCAIRVAIDSDDTSVPIDPPIGRWTTTANDLNESLHVPLYAAVGGERVKVSAIATTAATVVAAGTADHDDNAAVTPADYAGGAAGDWAFVAARVRGTAGRLAITDATYTYTLLHQQGGLYLWVTLRASAAPAPTVTPTGGAAGDSVSAVQFGFASMPITLDDPTDAIIVATGIRNTSAQNINYRRLRTGTLPGRLVLLVAGKSDDWTGVAPPSGFTELVDTSTTSGSDQGLYVAYRIDTTATAVEAGQLAVTGGATAVSESMVLALGSGFQTLTVERSANGVVKSHAAAAPIETVDPLIWAL